MSFLKSVFLPDRDVPNHSRTLALPPLVASAAFDALGAPGSSSLATVTRSGREARLKLVGEPRNSAPPRPCYWPYREMTGRLRYARWHPDVAVRIELLPWSRSRTMIEMYPTGSPFLPAAVEASYNSAAPALLRLLTTMLEAWPLKEIIDLETAMYEADVSGDPSSIVLDN